VDNNYLDSGTNKSGFIHTLPSGSLSPSLHSAPPPPPGHLPHSRAAAPRTPCSIPAPPPPPPPPGHILRRLPRPPLPPGILPPFHQVSVAFYQLNEYASFLCLTHKQGCWILIGFPVTSTGKLRCHSSKKKPLIISWHELQMIPYGTRNLSNSLCTQQDLPTYCIWGTIQSRISWPMCGHRQHTRRFAFVLGLYKHVLVSWFVIDLLLWTIWSASIIQKFKAIFVKLAMLQNPTYYVSTGSQ
jgi:hypothetical protein